MRSTTPLGAGAPRAGRLALLAAAALIAGACAGAGGGARPVTATGTGTLTLPSSQDPAASDAPAAAGAGDVPDNAVFLTYKDPASGFRIQYVEGWQVASAAGAVTIRDKDSSEQVALQALPADVPAFVSGTDLPGLKALAGFSLLKQDAVGVGSASYQHLQYRALSAPDPVTGKRVPTLVDRYYVPGASQLAVVTLSTPDGVDNVDAFRQMIGSFAWH